MSKSIPPIRSTAALLVDVAPRGEKGDGADVVEPIPPSPLPTALTEEAALGGIANPCIIGVCVVLAGGPPKILAAPPALIVGGPPNTELPPISEPLAIELPKPLPPPPLLLLLPTIDVAGPPNTEELENRLRGAYWIELPDYS